MIRQASGVCQTLCFHRRFLLWRSCQSVAMNAKQQAKEGDNTDKKKSRPPKGLTFELQNIHNGVDLVKKYAWASFDETVEVSVNLNVDPRKQNQAVKGVALLPHGVGKKVRVAAICNGDDISKATLAGADAAGAEELIAMAQTGDFPFDRVVATPEMMPQLSKIGKILGPRGLMPNPKMGTVTTDISKAVKNAKAGAVQFRVEKQGIVHAGIGKVSFPKAQLLDNARAFFLAIGEAKPEGLKGKYIKTAHICSTMGPGIPLDIATVDPNSPRFLLDSSALGEEQQL